MTSTHPPLHLLPGFSQVHADRKAPGPSAPRHPVFLSGIAALHPEPQWRCSSDRQWPAGPLNSLAHFAGGLWTDMCPPEQSFPPGPPTPAGADPGELSCARVGMSLSCAHRRTGMGGSASRLGVQKREMGGSSGEVMPTFSLNSSQVYCLPGLKSSPAETDGFARRHGRAPPVAPVVKNPPAEGSTPPTPGLENSPGGGNGNPP